MTATAKLTRRGTKQSLTLPAAFQFPGTTVRLRRAAQGVLVSPDKRDLAKRRRVFAKLAGSCLDFPDIPRPSDRELPPSLAW